MSKVKISAASLLIAQGKALGTQAQELSNYLSENALDGLDYMEMEVIDSMINSLLRQCQSMLGAIGEPLKAERESRRG